MNINDFDPPLDPDAESLAYKLEAYLKSKSGNLLDLVTLRHKKNKYYWCILVKSFILVNGDSEMYLLPWEKTKKNEYHVYSPYSFAQGAVFLVPQDELVYLGAN
jgi:hypothetical protein